MSESKCVPAAWRFKERINKEFDSDWILTSHEPPDGVRVIAKEPLYTAPPGWKLVPIEPTPQMLACIVHYDWPQDWEAGKQLQREQYGRLDPDARVPAKTEYERAVGQYQRLLAVVPTLYM